MLINNQKMPNLLKKYFLGLENLKDIFSIIFSLLLLLFPIFFCIYFYINFNFSFRIVFLISFLLHLILLPVLYIINDKNAWSYDFHNPMYGSWLHPRIIKQISLAVIYPYIFGVYYSFIRYNRLGSTVNIDFSIAGEYQYAIIIIIIVIPYFCILFLPNINKLKNFITERRNILWNSTVGLFYSWYIHKLSKNYFFFIIEKIYKAYRLIQGYCVINSPIYWHSNEKIAWYKYILNFIYLNSLNIFYILTFGGVILEILVKKQIHFGFYILFLIPIIRMLVTFWISIGKSYLNVPACLADYLYTDWTNLKFPSKFEACIGNSDIIYPFTLYPTEEQKIKLKEISLKYRPKYLPYRPKTKRSDHQQQLIERVKGHPWGIRFAADYWDIPRKTIFSHRKRDENIPRKKILSYQ